MDNNKQKVVDVISETVLGKAKNIYTKSIAKADFDKSYKTTIVGCNRYFTDDVPEETQAELIKKYNIPEVSVSGVYYTFRINGNWYVKSSDNDFKLYEEVVVRVPNGNWDNMFIEVQRDTVGESGDNSIGVIIGNHNELFNDYNGETQSYLEDLAEQENASEWLQYNHIEGYNNKVYRSETVHEKPHWNADNKIVKNHIQGESNNLYSSTRCLLGGCNNTIDNSIDSIIIGSNHNFQGGCYRSLVLGSNNTDRNKTDTGHYILNNGIMLGENACLESNKDVIVVGNGRYYAGELNRGNSFRVTQDGEMYLVGQIQSLGGKGIYVKEDYKDDLYSGNVNAKSFTARHHLNCYGIVSAESYNTTGQDYSEYYEWLDGNENNEDRRGLFVTVSGRKIRLANKGDDYILGVVSATPTIVGNSAELEWCGHYKKDIYGSPIYDENGNKIVSDNYDETIEYKPRSKRKEYSPIGTHGQLVVVDNGKCIVDGYCKCGDNGVAIPSTKQGYRVTERLDDTHIRIIIK